MAVEEVPQETKVNSSGMVTIPVLLRRRLDIEPGDKIQWDVNDDGQLTVEIVHQREGAFDDFEPVEWEEDAVEDHDLMGVDEELEGIDQLE